MAKKKRKGSGKERKGPPKKQKAPTGPPLPLDCEDPSMLRQLKDFSKFYANPTVYNQPKQNLFDKE
ncbi:hypothetical protein HaLaN_22027 [Haematococcus lacustris]|uniref:Uncharacterized protein n=1 Tax=Haematococcus lacustris TaxID=44745 RepID=A0A699ZZI0_HAELA|nr:hypothetical protein HaLaN_22027 [Haematococcus lacustris]